MTCNKNEMNQNKLAQLAGDLYVAKMSKPSDLINFGGVTTLNSTLDGDTDRISIPVNNRGELSGTSVTPIINVEFLETVDLEKVALLYGLELNVISGTEVTGHEEILKCLETEIDYQLANKNANGTKVTITSIIPVINGVEGTPLILGTDYTTDLNVIGETTINLDESVPTEGVEFKVIYSYTPAASMSVTGKKRFKSDELFRVVIVSEADSQGRRNIVELNTAVFEGQYVVDFNDLSTAGALVGTTGLFRGKRNSEIKFTTQTID